MDPITTKQLKSLLELCTRYGVKSIRTSTIELVMGDAPLPLPNSPEAPISHLNANGGVSGMEETKPLTDEQILFYSSQDM